jgi:uncharacterized protein YceK
MKRLNISCALLACLLLSGCGSPEARRTRGSGPGADVGNRPAIAKMHEGAQPFWKTPERLTNKQGPLDAARQADRLSR